MQNTLGVRNVKSIGFFKETFSISILRDNRKWISGRLDILHWVDGLPRLRYVLTSRYKAKKFLLIQFFEILISQKKSQLISAVCLHFLKRYINSKIFMVQSQNYITVR